MRSTHGHMGLALLNIEMAQHALEDETPFKSRKEKARSLYSRPLTPRHWNIRKKRPFENIFQFSWGISVISRVLN